MPVQCDSLGEQARDAGSLLGFGFILKDDMYIFICHQMHVADCPDRASFDQYKYNIADNKPKQQPVVAASAVNYDAVASEDNWDDVSSILIRYRFYVAIHYTMFRLVS